MAGRYLCPMWCEKMKKIEMTYENYISNEEIKIGDVFHGIYEVVSKPKITKAGYEWKIYHRRWKVDLRMIRPEPSAFLDMPEHVQRSICGVYQRVLIPMQQNPFIESFYDVRHIGGGTAFFTEWLQRGSLADCMENGSLYEGTNDEVSKRLLGISKDIARALQYLTTEIPGHGSVCPENIMLTDCFDVKLRVAHLDLMMGKQLGDDMQLWALTVLEMYLGQKINADIADVAENYIEYKSQMRIKIPEDLEVQVISALTGMLRSWDYVFLYLNEPVTLNYLVNETAMRNNYALRLIDCGKWKAAYDILLDEKESLRYNFLQLLRYLNERAITSSWGGIDARMMINQPTDILLWAEYNNRDMVRRYLDRWGDDVPKSVECYLPEIHEKLLDRPHMTRIDLEPDDPRLNRTDDGILIELDGENHLFMPLPDGEKDISIPSKDGLAWRKNKLVLPGSGVIEGLDYTIKEFNFKANGSSFMFDEELKWLLVDEERLYPLEQYDNRFRAPFLIYTND